jgi:hypothetical protein
MTDPIRRTSRIVSAGLLWGSSDNETDEPDDGSAGLLASV